MEKKTDRDKDIKRMTHTQIKTYRQREKDMDRKTRKEIKTQIER